MAYVEGNRMTVSAFASAGFSLNEKMLLGYYSIDNRKAPFSVK